MLCTLIFVLLGIMCIFYCYCSSQNFIAGFHCLFIELQKYVKFYGSHFSAFSVPYSAFFSPFSKFHHLKLCAVSEIPVLISEAMCISGLLGLLAPPVRQSIELIEVK